MDFQLITRGNVNQPEAETIKSYSIEAEEHFDTAHLRNIIVGTLVWNNLSVVVKDRSTKQQKSIIENVSGVLYAGEVLALLGPSGCGKTTLLNALGRRIRGSATIHGETFVNGAAISDASFRQITSYVEQHDALIGSLTVRETIDFAARLTHQKSWSSKARRRRVNGLLDAFGLRAQQDTIIGTPIREGVSGGQKKRTSVAAALVTGPKILFLDEPTSGLDSAASWEVISHIKSVAKEHNLIVIASIHQPSTNVFNLFDKVTLLSNGQTQFFGTVVDVNAYFSAIGYAMPMHVNPAEHLLDLVNTDFTTNGTYAYNRLQTIQEQWKESSRATRIRKELITIVQSSTTKIPPSIIYTRASTYTLIKTLMHRSLIKSFRDVIAYGVRLLMYSGLAVMMGTVWVRLPATQDSITPFKNVIFFSSAFMSFMAVAYIPAILEDRLAFIKERQNGMYSAKEFMIANFIVGLPFLFIFTVVFSCIAYWLIGLHSTPTAFFTWVLWLFLDLLAAESLVVLIASIFPVFVVALALVSFANGLWMCAGGFLVSPKVLNSFYLYVFYYIDYQAYVFRGMAVNEFSGRTYACGAGCRCSYASPLADQCLIDGDAVLDTFGYNPNAPRARYMCILVAIIAVYRILGWIVLALRR